LNKSLPAGHKYDRFWADEFMKKLKEDRTIQATEKLNTITDPEEALKWLRDLIDVVTPPKVKKVEEKKEEVVVEVKKPTSY